MWVPLKKFCFAPALMGLSFLTTCVTVPKEQPRINISAGATGKLYPPFTFYGIWRWKGNTVQFQRPPKSAVYFRMSGPALNERRHEYNIKNIIRNQDGSITFVLFPAHTIGMRMDRTFLPKKSGLLEIREDGTKVFWKRVKRPAQ